MKCIINTIESGRSTMASYRSASTNIAAALEVATAEVLTEQQQHLYFCFPQAAKKLLVFVNVKNPTDWS